ncbi:hypothetical protein CEP51_014857 [Fusarium floridanum]|uniref:Heterokaryon incompatibility domain-containing protein n=1 Tax=Fusarium floridanum TaxID=1325733 RepID=A0A428PL33_9HYPO|nr:hypothetical protein CEP51_014857 [Fusarium floridanum]
MHLCDLIEYEFIGTDTHRYFYNDDGVNMALQQLRDQTDCQTCTLFAKTIDYRLRHASTWAEQHGVWTSGPKQRPLDEEIRDARVSFKITDSMGTQNWSFGFEGWTHRHVLVARASVGRQGVDIIWQRSGPGGLVPVSRMPTVGNLTNEITLSAEVAWRTEGEGPQLRKWDENPEPIRAGLHPTFGRLRPLVIDFDRLKRWIGICDSTHDFCQAKASPAIPRLRLISVQDMCIKEVSNATNLDTAIPAYATLSYVWGSTSFQRLTRSNLDKLMEPHGLDAITLPTTIYDTISICERLKIGHLWIDSLCIIQDEESDMIEFIDKMDVIYSGSILTIIAASGLSADSGIPGVCQGTRTVEQKSLEARGVPLIDCVDHKMMRYSTRFEEPEWISGTPWAQRAWTFQEAFVSRRMLIFTAEQVYWNCREGMLSEDTVEHFPPNGGSVRNAEQRIEDDFSSLEYRNIAQTFAARKLTFESDIMRAYLGTQTSLEKRWHGQKFSWGLPHGAFGRFLMWEWASRTGRRMRRGTHAIKSTTGGVIRSTFPSWSWLSWTNGGQLIEHYGDEDGARTPSFFVYDYKNSLVSIRDAEHWDFPFNWLGKLLDTAPGRISKMSELSAIEGEFQTLSPISSSLKPSLLVFFTEVATVRYDPTVTINPERYINAPLDLQSMNDQFPFSIKIGDSFHRVYEAQNSSLVQGSGLQEVELVAVFAGIINSPRKHRGLYRVYCWPIIQGEEGVYVRASYMATIIARLTGSVSDLIADSSQKYQGLGQWSKILHISPYYASWIPSAILW